MNQEELEKRVRHIQIHSRKAVMEILAGEYRSGFKGTGVEFEDIREYQYGDDVRTMDWNVTARTGVPHVKLFNEERELTLYFLIDISGSGDFGSGEHTKRDIAAQVFALLAFASSHNNDNVGLILFSDKVEHYIKPGKGKNHIMNMVSTILSFRAESKKTSIQDALDFMLRVRKKRCVMFLFSDFIDNGYHESLREAGRLHDLICVNISDVRERKLESAGIIEFVDAETEKVVTIDFKNRKTIEMFAEKALERTKALQEFCYEINADLLNLSTDDDYLHKIIAFFRARRDRSADART